MTVQLTTRRRPKNTGRVAALLAYDGPITAALLRAFQFFLVGVSFLACLMPAFVFQALVGWQPTHIALWLGSISLLPIAPAVIGALIAARGVLLAGGEAGSAGVFWHGFAQGIRSRWWLAAGVSGGVLVLGYDIVLLGDSDAVLLLATVGLALLVVLTIGVSSTAVTDTVSRPWSLIVQSVRAIAARPHAALSWILLIVVGVGASMLPVVGGAVALFAPALVACAIVICNRALHFHAEDKEHTS
jgi:hypothetical protein